MFANFFKGSIISFLLLVFFYSSTFMHMQSVSLYTHIHIDTIANVQACVCWLFILPFLFHGALFLSPGILGIVFFIGYSILLLKLNHQFRAQVAMKVKQSPSQVSSSSFAPHIYISSPLPHHYTNTARCGSWYVDNRGNHQLSIHHYSLCNSLSSGETRPSLNADSSSGG